MRVVKLERDLYTAYCPGFLATGTKNQIAAFLFAEVELSAQEIQDLFPADELIDSSIFYIQEPNSIAD